MVLQDMCKVTLSKNFQLFRSTWYKEFVVLKSNDISKKIISYKQISYDLFIMLATVVF